MARSMKAALAQQLSGMKEALLKNMESVKALISTSKALGEVIVKLQADPNTDSNKETIAQLEDTRKNISKSVEDILRNTESLFATYKDMVDSL